MRVSVHSFPTPIVGLVVYDVKQLLFYAPRFQRNQKVSDRCECLVAAREYT